MRHIPNILSAFRIVLIPFFVYQAIQGNMLAAAVILIASALTDIVDGFLARRFNWVTNLGKVLDPAADKLTQITVCVLFFMEFSQYWVFFAVLLLRDLVFLVVGGYFIKCKVKLSGARWFGKLSTVMFFVVMIVIALFPALPPVYVYILLALTTVTAFTAMVMYIPEFMRYKRRVEPDKRL